MLQWLAVSESERPLRYFEKEARAINMGTRLRDFMIKLTRPRQAINFEKAFRAFDEDGDGDITTIEFTDGLKKLGIHLSPQQTMDILRALSSANLDIRKKTLDITLDLVSPSTIGEVMQVLKKEVSKAAEKRL